MNQWLEALKSCRDNNTPCVLVTIIGVEGSMPQGIGTKMLVTADTIIGSIGGSKLEFDAIQFARTLLRDNGAATTQFFPSQETSGAEADAHCSARATLLFEPFQPNQFTIVLFGAGHVGKALVHVLSPLPCRITWIDDREGIFPENLNLPSNITTILNPNPEQEVARAPAGSFFLLMSHSHDQDYRIGEEILSRNDFRYFGMIGSARKREQFEQRMLEKGFNKELLAEKLVCPMGLSEISGRQPGEIAIAIAAQILLVWEQTTTNRS